MVSEPPTPLSGLGMAVRVDVASSTRIVTEVHCNVALKRVFMARDRKISQILKIEVSHPSIVSGLGTRHLDHRRNKEDNRSNYASGNVPCTTSAPMVVTPVSCLISQLLCPSVLV